jgi:Dockerin type I domain
MLGNGRRYYYPPPLQPDGPRSTPALCLQETSLWVGDYSNFSATNSGSWEQVLGPPIYFGGRSTASGRPYVATQITPNGYLVFLSDLSHVHVAEINQPTPTTKGKPEDASWHRLDGRDASQSKRDNQLFNQLFVHVDPHAIAVSPFFQISLRQASDVEFPYDRNSELDISKPIVGTIWMANDGGVYRSIDGGRNWQLLPGLPILPYQSQARFVGLALEGNPTDGPALYFGVPDNDDFFTLDGGQTWHDDPQEGCGDCLPYFSDPAQPNRVLKSGRFDEWRIYDSSNVLLYPDPRNSLHVKPTIRLPAGSSVLLGPAYLKGYNPIILTPITEQPLPDGDYLLIRQVNPNTRVLLRTTTPTQITDPTDWDLPSTKVSQVGPPLPLNNIDVVQASGGHRRPVFYVGNGTQVWRWTTGMQNWEPIVDGTSLVARRFFVHPYDPNVIYVIADNAIMRSDNGGQVWHPDISLDRAVTEDGVFSYLGTFFDGNTVGETFVINAMIFDHRRMGTRFAVGNAGVFFTLDGTNWERLVSTTALPGHAVAAYFDGISDPLDQALYVAVSGRGILRISPIPDPDIDSDGDVDRNDLNILLRDLGKSVSQSACGGRCDLNVDGHISDLDAHQLIQMCSRPQCATQ